MAKNNLIEIYSSDSEIYGDGNLKLFSDELIKLRSQGFKNVRMVLLFDPLSAENKNIDKELFSTIKLKQTLPDEVIYQFLKNKGSLAGKEFNN